MNQLKCIEKIEPRLNDCDYATYALNLKIILKKSELLQRDSRPWGAL